MNGPILVVCGAINWDINLYVKRFGSPGEEVPVPKIERVPGGKGANVAVAVARILGKGKCEILGGIGNDEIGKKHLEEFEREGVGSRWLTTFKDVESGQAYILIDEKGENQINTHFGANIALNVKDVERIRNLLDKIEFLAIMDPPIAFTEGILKLAKNAIKVWSPGVRVRNDRKSVTSFLKYIDYLVLNEHELLDLSGVTDMSKVYRELEENNPKLRVIVTQGSKGVTLLTPSEVKFVKGIELKKIGLKVVNTTGCGDTFVGAFIAYLVLGAPQESALEMANLAAAIKASKYETRGSPTKSELECYRKKLFSIKP
ncbi:MAG: PfkB family carbohydrate kinase [Nitrososphaeria archaeon]|jgi:ribokinase